MSEFNLEYKLEDGYVHNWLVAGPLVLPIANPKQLAEDEFEAQILRQYHHKASDIHAPPIERAVFQIGDASITWRYLKCLDDHWIDLSATYPTGYIRSWAYAQVESLADQKTTFVLTTSGLADVWLNREHVHQHPQPPRQDLQETAFQGTLQEGTQDASRSFRRARPCRPPS